MPPEREGGSTWSRRYRRPYALTRGRTQPSVHADLEVETLVSTTVLGEASPQQSRRQREIAMLCREVLSVAEISAHLDVPLGVARVLVGDMAAEGYVQLHRPASAWDRRPDVPLMLRVLDHLRAL